MLTIGAHISTAGGFEKMGEHALALGANTFAFFTRNPRGGNAKTIDPVDAAALRKLMSEHRFGKIVAHASYTLNPAAKTAALREYARTIFTDDLQRMEYLPDNYYNFHPGSHVGQGLDVGIAHVIEMLNAVLTPSLHTVVLLETMSGKGSEIGGTFEALARMIDQVHLQACVGICLDTCHIWDAGYNIADDLDGVLTRFDKTIGLSRLKAVHLNDSLNPAAAKKTVTPK